MNSTEIMKKALVTQDPGRLFELLQEAIEEVKFLEAKNAFAEGKIKKLQDQVQRQVQMITNLENALR